MKDCPQQLCGPLASTRAPLYSTLIDQGPVPQALWTPDFPHANLCHARKNLHKSTLCPSQYATVYVDPISIFSDLRRVH